MSQKESKLFIFLIHCKLMQCLGNWFINYRKTLKDQKMKLSDLTNLKLFGSKMQERDPKKTVKCQIN